MSKVIIIVFWLLFFSFSNQVVAGQVEVAIFTGQSVVKEGDIATVTVEFTSNYTNSTNGCDIKLSLVDGGSATSGSDFSKSGESELVYFPPGGGGLAKIDALTKKVEVKYFITKNDGIESNETVSAKLNVSFTGTEKCNIGTVPPWPSFTIVDTDAIVSNPLTSSLTVLASKVTEGAGSTDIIKLDMSLPNGVNADANCNATASVKVVGGTAISGVDFNFTPTTLSFKQGDGNTKTKLISLNLLAGIAGDGNKTVELETTFVSTGTAKGNSCPLASTASQRTTITIEDTAVLSLTGLLQSTNQTLQAGQSLSNVATLSLSLPANTVADSNCNAVAEVKVVGGTAKSGVDFDFPRMRFEFSKNDGSFKSEAVLINILDGLAGDGDKTVLLEAVFTSRGGSTGNSCPLISTSPQSITLTIKDAPTKNLTIKLDNLKTTVQEGAGVLELANIKFSLPENSQIDANCNASAEVKVVGGTAQSGVDFRFTPIKVAFGQGDSSSKTKVVTLTLLSGEAGDGDKTVLLEAVFTSRGGSTGNSCPLISTSPQSMTLTIKDTPTKNLTIKLDNLKTTVQEGAGVLELANIKFSLPENSQIDANCNASAEVKVVGGTAQSGVDFRFTPIKVAFGQGDSSSKTKVVTLTLLPGEVGDGDKTIELETTFNSIGGATGNSCPLASATKLAKARTQKIVITIKDTPPQPIRPRVEVKLNDIVLGLNTSTASFPVSIVQTPINSNIDCNARVELIASDLKGLVNISPTQFNKNGGNAVVNIIKREQTDQVVTVEAKLSINDSVCDKAGNASAKITINAKTNTPAISTSISANANVAIEQDSINVSYKLAGDLTTCQTVNPLIVSAETTASQDQYRLDTKVNLLDTPVITVKILKQNNKQESVLVLAAKAEGCQLDVNNTVSIRILKKKAVTIKQEPEALNKAICLTLQQKTTISGSGTKIETAIINKLSGKDRSYYISNCQQGANIRNVEPEEIASQANAVLAAANQQLKNVRSRLDKLRSTKGQRGIDVSDATLNIQGETISVGLLGGAAGDNESELLNNSRWGVFANGEYGFGSKDRGIDTIVSTGDRNFDFNSTGLTIGADYRLNNEKTIVGMALGYKNTEIDFTTQSGGTKTKGYNLSLYGTYLLSEKSYLDMVLGYGNDRLTSSRPVNNDGSGNIGNKTTFAIGKPKAQELTFSLGGGYEFNQGEWSLSPYGRIDLTKGNIDPYNESASHSSASTSMFSFDKQTIQSLTSTLGIKASKVISTSSGVFIPNISLEWQHEFKQRGDISGQSLFVENNPNLKLSSAFNETHKNRIDSNYYTLGLGVSGTLSKGRSAYLNLESRLGDSSIEDNTVKAGFRWEF